MVRNQTWTWRSMVAHKKHDRSKQPPSRWPDLQQNKHHDVLASERQDKDKQVSEPRPTHTVEESMIWRNGRNNGIQQERQRIMQIAGFWAEEFELNLEPEKAELFEQFIRIVKESAKWTTTQSSAKNATPSTT